MPLLKHQASIKAKNRLITIEKAEQVKSNSVEPQREDHQQNSTWKRKKIWRYKIEKSSRGEWKKNLRWRKGSDLLARQKTHANQEESIKSRVGLNRNIDCTNLLGDDVAIGLEVRQEVNVAQQKPTPHLYIVKPK